MVEKQAAARLNATHKEEIAKKNALLTKPAPYAANDWVWVLRPRGSGVSKLDTWWVGPAQVIRRTGDLSYEVRVKPNVVQDLHMDQLKPFIDDRLEGPCVELFHHTTGYRPMATESDEWEVDRILRHRKARDGQLEFLTRWEGSDEETWEPARNFVARYNYKMVKYLQDHGLECDMAKVLGGVPTL